MFGGRKNKEYNAVLSFLLAAFVFVAFLFSAPELSNAGDQNISTYLMTGTSRPGFYFISPFLAVPLRGLYTILPGVNWWFVFSAAVLFFGLWIFLYLIIRIYGGGLDAFTLAAVFSRVFWEAVCREPVNFTQTAGTACLAGMLLTVTGGLQKEKYGCFHFITGIFLMILSGFTRFEVMLMCVPFGVMAVCYITFLSVPESRKTGKHGEKKWKLLFPLCLAVIFCYGADTAYNMSDPVRKEYVAANAGRSDIYDYWNRYPSYEEYMEQYAAAGADETMLNMIRNNYTSDANYFTSENLEKIVALRGKSNMKAPDMIRKLEGHGGLWLWLLLLGIYVIILKRKAAVLPLAGNVAGFFAGSLFFIYIGRIEWRVVSCVVLAAALFYLFMSGQAGLREKKKCLVEKMAQICLTIYIITVNCLTIGGGYFAFTDGQRRKKSIAA